jgi:hypothetical protein
MKKVFSTLLLFILFFNAIAQEVEPKKKWSLGFSFTPNISYLYNPTKYFGGVVPTGYNYRSMTSVKDRPLFELMNFGIRISNVLNEKAEIETGIIFSNKDYYAPQGWINDEMPYLYFRPRSYFIEVPLIYKHNISRIGNYNLNLIGGIIASIPIYKYIDYSPELYLFASYDNENALTRNLDYYPFCMNINLGVRFLRNKINNIQFEFGPIFQSAIMPFSRKIEGNTIDVRGYNGDFVVINPEKGYMPYFIGFDLILRFNFFDLTKYK